MISLLKTILKDHKMKDLSFPRSIFKYDIFFMIRKDDINFTGKYNLTFVKK